MFGKFILTVPPVQKQFGKNRSKNICLKRPPPTKIFWPSYGPVMFRGNIHNNFFYTDQNLLQPNHKLYIVHPNFLELDYKFWFWDYNNQQIGVLISLTFYSFFCYLIKLNRCWVLTEQISTNNKKKTILSTGRIFGQRDQYWLKWD